MTGKKNEDYSVVKMMSMDNPIAVYQKAKGHLGKVQIQRLNSFTNNIETILLYSPPDGQPDADTCFVELWSEEEHIFFKRANRKHLESGAIVLFESKRETEVKKTPNNMPDSELKELVVAPWLKLKKVVESMTSEAALLRVLQFAEEAERPEKTMLFLRERLSLIQSGELE